MKLAEITFHSTTFEMIDFSIIKRRYNNCTTRHIFNTCRDVSIAALPSLSPGANPEFQLGESQVVVMKVTILGGFHDP